MRQVSLEAFCVYLVQPLIRREGDLYGKTRPYILLRVAKARTRRGGYLMVPLSRQEPRGAFHVEVVFQGEVSYAVLDSPKMVPRGKIIKACGPVDFYSVLRIRQAWAALLS